MALNRIENTPNYNPASLDSLFGIFETFIRQYLEGYMCVMMPVEVAFVAEGGEFVNVKPLMQRIDSSGKAIAITDDDIISNIPVLHLKSAMCEISTVPTVGDQGFLFAGNFDMSNYKTLKQASVIGSFRHFNWADGVFLPFTFSTVGTGLNLKNGESSINIAENNITITTSQVTVNSDSATISAQSVNLGGDGGVGVARIGDQVQVGSETGMIIGGSQTVKAV